MISFRLLIIMQNMTDSFAKGYDIAKGYNT